MLIPDKISAEEFIYRASQLRERFKILDTLFEESDALAKSIDADSLSADERDDVWDALHELAHAGGYEMSGKINGGFWLPSRC